MADVFVSYAREDQDVVRRVVGHLTAAGREVWVDFEDIPPTAEWMAEIRSAIDSSDAFAFVVSPASAASGICRQELEHAVERGKRVIALTTEATEAPAALAAAQRIDLADPTAAATALSAVLDADGEWSRLHTQLLVRALEWEAGSHDRNLLLRGATLDNAEAQLAEQRSDPSPTALQSNFVLESRAASTRRQRGALSISLAIVVVIALLAVVAMVQRARANDRAALATSRGLAASSSSVREDDAQLALILALAAWDAKATPAAEQAVRQAVVATRPDGDGDVVLRVSSDGRVGALAFAPDGVHLAIGDAGGDLRIWNRREGTTDVLEPFSAPLDAVAYSPDGRLIAAVGPQTRVYDVRKRQPLWVADAPNIDVAFAPDGEHIAAGGQDAVVRVWNVRTGRMERELTPGGQLVRGVAYSPDGKHVASVGGIGVRVSNADRRSAPVELKGHEGIVERVAFSPDGQTLATAGDDGRIRLWDWRTRTTTLVLADDTPVYGLAYSPDGHTLLTTGSNGAFALWVLGSGPQRVEIQPPSGVGASVAFAPDGRTIAVGRYPGTVTVMPCEVCASAADVVKLARSRVKRSLTSKEKERYPGADRR